MSNYQFTQSISDIAATFGIDKNELYFKCCDTLSQKLKSQEIPLLLSKEKMLISNMEVFFEKSETDILKELLKQYSNEVVLSLAEVCKKLPDNIKKNLPPKKQALQVSNRLINSIITDDNYLLLLRLFGPKWIEKIKQACHLEASSESPYEQITKSIFRRICMANDCLQRNEPSRACP